MTAKIVDVDDRRCAVVYKERRGYRVEIYDMSTDTAHVAVGNKRGVLRRLPREVGEEIRRFMR